MDQEQEQKNEMMKWLDETWERDKGPMSLHALAVHLWPNTGKTNKAGRSYSVAAGVAAQMLVRHRVARPTTTKGDWVIIPENVEFQPDLPNV